MKNLQKIYNEAFINSYNESCRKPEYKITGELENARPSLSMDNFFGCGSAWVGIPKKYKELLAELTNQGHKLSWDSYRKEFHLSFCPRAFNNGFVQFDEDACRAVADSLTESTCVRFYMQSYLD